MYLNFYNNVLICIKVRGGIGKLKKEKKNPGDR